MNALPENSEPEGIAIIGMSGRFPGARSVDQFWRNLVDGVESISHFSEEETEFSVATAEERARGRRVVRARGILDDVDKFDAAFFGIYPREAEVMDPQHRFFLECSWEALESAGYDPEAFPGLIGVYGGLSMNTYLLNNLCRDRTFAANFTGNYQVAEYQVMLGNDKDFLPTRVSYKLNLRGPSMSIQTACSTSLVAVCQACTSLLNYQCDLALAGGVSISFPQKRDYLYEEDGMVSVDGTCRAFDAEAKGTVFGHGTAVVLLKRLSEAVADGDNILAVIRGSAVNNDGSAKIGYAAPSVQAQADVIAMAQAAAAVDPSTVSYIEAHGTGTPLGDPIEVAALTQAFRMGGATANGFCALGTGKTNISHLDVAAGATGLIKTVLQLRHGLIPPLLHFKSPNPNIDFGHSPFYPVAKLTEWKRGTTPRRAGVSAFGVGGTNAHVVVEEAPERRPGAAPRSEQLLPLSAKSAGALDAMTRNLADWLASPPSDLGIPESELLADVAFTLQRGRRGFSHRRAIVAVSVEDAVAKLRALEPKVAPTGVAPASEPGVVFVFPGQGAQYVGMGRELYDREPAFREEMDRCAQLLKEPLGVDLREVIYPDDAHRAESAARINETWITQPAIFAIEYAMARLWMSWGVEPTILIGHSIGEYVCAVLAGTFTLEEALSLLAVRAKLIQGLPGGSMLAVRLPGAEMEPILPEGAAIAAYNSAKLCTVSGPTPVLEALQKTLEGRKVAARMLATSHAFHSPMMDPVLAEFTAAAAATHRAAPTRRWISTSTGTWVTAEDMADAGYWANQLRHAVRFADALDAVVADPGLVLLEVGPGQSLSQLARQHPARHTNFTIVTSLDASPTSARDGEAMLSALGRLWIAGVKPDWEAVHRGERRYRVPLPTYPFERKRFWVDRPADAIDAAVPVAPAVEADAESARAVDPQLAMAPAAAAVASSAAPEPAASAAAAPPRRDQLTRDVRQLIEALSGMDVGGDDQSFLELGFDSLFLTQVSLALHKRFGVKVSFRQIMRELGSVGALASHLDAALPKTVIAAPSSKPVAPAPVAGAASPPAVTALRTAAPSVPSAPVNLPPDAAGLRQLLEQQMVMLQQQMALLQSMQLPGAAPATAPVRALTASPAPIPAASAAPAAAANDTPAAKAFGPFKDLDRAVDAPLAPHQQAFIDSLTARYTRRTAGSKAHTQKYRQWYADPRTASGFNRLWKEMVYQIVVTKSQGSRLWDIDGNEYIDMLNGFGPGFLGHSKDFVVSALKDQLDKGIEVGPQSLLAGEAAKMFCELTGNDRASFVCTGSEAVYAAMRLARTATGRDKIVVFSRDYHGNFDEVLVRAVGKPPQLRSLPIAPGIPFRAVEDMYVLDYGSDEALQFIRDHADEIAGVLVEPVQSRRPEWRPVEFIKALRQLTSERGCLLIFDEVITGLRAGPGGAQAWYGVKADLATYGKVVGAEMPIGIVAGKAEFMDTFDGGFWQYGDDSFPAKGVTFFAGTFVRHPLAIAAVHAMLTHLKRQGPEFWDAINRRAARLAESLDRFFVDHGIPIRVPHFCSLMFVRMGDDQKYGNLLFYRLREKGIFLLENFPSYLTAAHSDEDVDRVIAAFKESAIELVQAGLLTGNAPATAVGTAGPATPAIAPRDASAGAPAEPIRHALTEAQMEMWMAAQISPEAAGSHTGSNVISLRGTVDDGRLKEAITQVVSRHEALRSTFSDDGTEIEVHPSVAVDMPVRDFSTLAPAEREREFAALLARESRREFDLRHGPLFAFQLVHMAPDDHRLIFSVQMIVCDGWGYTIVLEEIGAVYSALVEGRDAALSEPTPLREYIAWQNRPERAAEIAACETYWLSRFTPPPVPLDLPVFKTRPPIRTHSGARESLRLPADQFQSLKAAARSLQATPFSVLLAAYQIWLHRLSGQPDLVVGVPFAGQSGSGLESLVGQCVHTLPFRLDVRPGESFKDFLARSREAFLDAQENWNYGFGKLVQKLELPSDPGRLPLVSVIFNLDVPLSSVKLSGCEVEITASPRAYFQYEMGFNLVDEGSTLLIECDYNSEIFDGETIRRWLGHYQTLLGGIVMDPGTAGDRLPLLDNGERERLCLTAPDLSAPIDPAATLHGAVVAQVRRTPNAVAVVAGQERLTYAELDDRSTRLASLLSSMGIAPEDRVGVCTERSADMVVALLAVLKAGGAYNPIDPEIPPVRIAALIEDVGAKIVLTHSSLVPTLPAAGPRLVCIDEVGDAMAQADPDWAPPVVSADHLAYVIFTSGSTGRPKGVEITHGAIVNFLRSMSREPGLGEDDVALALTTLSFDIAGLEIFLPLTVGARTVVVPREVLIEPQKLSEVAERERVTVMQATPATWRMLVNAGWKGNPRLKLLCGGESMPPDLAARLLRCGGELWNMYGPTETTVWSMVGQILDSAQITLGRPIANTWIAVVDAQMQQVPVGVPGEILIGGDGVARGYRHRPDLTAEKFIADPFDAGRSVSTGGRCYRTGDLARFRPNGQLEMLGRSDHQIKLLGHRIELGEIESILLENPKVRDAVVILRGSSDDHQVLVAYLTGENSGSAGSRGGDAELRSSLREALKQRLPAYMVPAGFVWLDSLPRTPEGKTNRAALPEPPPESFETGETCEAPRNEVEVKLSRIWCDALKLERVGIRDNFFEVGGQSLLAVSVFNRIQQEFGRRLPLATLLRAPTIAQLAEVLAAQSSTGARSWSSLVPIQPHGSKPPLFLVHGAGGNVLLYQALSTHLGNQQPFYGLQSRGLDGESTPLETIEDMATAYLEEIRSVQPHGPYYLGGYCLGGTVAYEMAQQLHAVDEEVALVALLDTYNFCKALKYSAASFVAQKVRFHLGNLRHLRVRDLKAYVREKARVAKDGEWANLFTSNKSSANGNGNGVARAESGPEASVQAINDRAAEAYLPQPFAGRLTLVKPHVNYKFYPDPNMGWSGLAAGGLDIVELPVNPHAMLVEPFVSQLAAPLLQRLAAAGVRAVNASAPTVAAIS